VNARELFENRLREHLETKGTSPDMAREIVRETFARTAGKLGAALDAMQTDADRETLSDQIETAKTFYVDSKGRMHRIAEMPGPYLKNAAAALKRTIYGGLLAFTVASMDDEIRRRDAARAQEGQHDDQA
jgi:hypothetical protein